MCNRRMCEFIENTQRYIHTCIYLKCSALVLIVANIKMGVLVDYISVNY